jgi:hypothetical protein
MKYQFVDIRDEEAVARSEKEGSYSYIESGGRGTTGSQGESAESQQERDYRASCKKSDIFELGAGRAGGIARQLITKVQKQLAYHKAQTDELEVTLDELHQFVNSLDTETIIELEQNE